MNRPFKWKVNEKLGKVLSSVGVGVWDWNLLTNQVIYSDAWARTLGYSVEELPQVVETWERMLLPSDLAYANAQIERHISGECPLYEAEFRMICKDGSIIWAQDKGQISEYDQNGKAVRFMGVLQNVSRLKNAELQLLEKQESLDLAVHVAALGTWDWDIPGNFIRYNDEYLNMLGYTQSDMDGSMEEWEAMNHPQDLPESTRLLHGYLNGDIATYECEIRMKHRDGHYIWTKDVGKIVEWDANGSPTRLIGGHLNIDALTHSKMRLKEAMEKLEHSNSYLTDQMESRNQELVEQDRMLWTVNQISRKLLAFQPAEDFEKLVQDCLCLLGESLNKNRIYIWKDQMDENGARYCTQIYEWVRGVAPIQGNEDFVEIPYKELPNFSQAIDDDRCLNSLLRDLSDSEKRFLLPQGIKTILMAPIAVNGNRWGFIGVDDCETEHLFSSIEENMLMMSGSMLANTIEKIEAEATLREMEQRTLIMLNATPLCCILWTQELQAMSCNEEAVRLFGISSQEEYLERFHELAPEYQPCGRNSCELVMEYIEKAFEEGYLRFEWMHQKLDGTLIPSEVTLVRIQYKTEFIVASYTRDLREEKAMIQQLKSQEDDLRTARDEALLNSKAKSNFLANMSHEIRTPMNAISGLSEIILRKSTNEETMEYAKGIKTASANLLNLINDILDISKVESGKLEIFNAPYDLSSLLDDVLTISRIRLGNKPLMFLADIDSHLPAQLIGDAFRIKQILINMLSNAIKFTHEGFIELAVSGTVEDGQAVLCFVVRDSGVGINTDDLNRVFAEFERVNTTKNRNIEGTGLGLAISRHLCEMMGGDIKVKSVFGEGSEFTATIPQACHSDQRLAQVSAEKKILLYEPRERYRNSIAKSIENLECICIPCANQSDLCEKISVDTFDYILAPTFHLAKVQSVLTSNKLSVPIAAFSDQGETSCREGIHIIPFPVNCLMLRNLLNGNREDDDWSGHNAENNHFIAPTARVLVVDDSPVNLQVAKGLMEPYQFVIDMATNGLEAVKCVQNVRYDLVFMDHMMPVMDGIDATVAIRQMKGRYYQDLPIVALTANALVGAREMFIREGMNDFISKPIEVNKLAQILLKWLPPKKVISGMLPALERAENGTPTQTIKGLDMKHGILSMGGSKENYMHILSIYHAEGVQKCSTLFQHVTNNDMKAFRAEIHALKSTSATIGAFELSLFAETLENAAQNQEVAWIHDQIDAFLTDFQAILNAIRVMLEDHSLQQPVKDEAAILPSGEMAFLRECISTLQSATELADIEEMEGISKELQAYQWSAPVAEELAAIQKHQSTFDYDSVLACIARLNAVE